MESVWYRFLQSRQLFSESAVLDTLAKSGLGLHLRRADDIVGPGIVFFDDITERVCQFLRESSDNGVNRVLAIAASSSLLSGGRAWELLHRGASDILAWDRLENPEREIVAKIERWSAIERIIESPLVQENLIGRGLAWTRVLRQCVEVAKFTDAAVLITGESGTGKELVARIIHTLDPRAPKRELVVLDCTTVVPELSGSEFFGHERGAFTGAVTSRDGAFALAHGGTLFLDEVGDLPIGLQAQLLRVVQEHTYKRVGDNTWRPTDFRLVCATNRDLSDDVGSGKFRSDLYYRIAVWACKLPPLRERPEDILPLARHFMAKLRPKETVPELSTEVREYLLRRQYPGNVRDLKQLISRIMYRHVGKGPITPGDIPDGERPTASLEHGDWCDVQFEQAIRRALALGAGLKEIGAAAESTAVRITVTAEEGNLRRAAQRLRVTDRTLQLRRAADREKRKAS